MHRRSHLSAAAACGFAVIHLAFTAMPAMADEAKQVFDSLFSSKLKTVAATADRADDVALAKELLTLAKASVNQPGLLALLCEAAHDLSSKHIDGYATAAESMQLLADTVEEKRPAAREKLIALLTKQSTAGKAEDREAAGEALAQLLTTIGDEKAEKKQYAEAAVDYRRAVMLATQRKSASLDEVKAKLEFALSRDRTIKQLARLQEKLLKDANDSVTAEEIVRTYIVDLDDPKSAEPFLNRAKDEQLKAIVLILVKPASQRAEAQCLMLGEWCKAQSEPARGPAKAILLAHARSALARFLELHASDDLQRRKAEVLLKQVDEARTALPVVATPPPAAELGDVFDFVKKFATGKSQSPASHYAASQSATSQWIHMHPLPSGENAGAFAVELPKIPKGNKLIMSFQTQVNAKSADGVRFLVLVAGKEVWSHTQKDDRKSPHAIDLTKFAGTTAEITLKVNCIQSQAFDDSTWADPVIRHTK